MSKPFRYALLFSPLAAVLLVAATITGYSDWVKRTTPGNPAAANLRMYADSTAAKFKCIDSTGAACYYDTPAPSVVLISTQTLGAPAATVTFSSIPGTYTGLMLKVAGRTTYVNATGQDDIFIRFNNDSGANYQREYWYIVAGNASAGGTVLGGTSGACLSVANANANANRMGTANIEIFGYAQTTFFKNMYCATVQPGGAALTQITYNYIEWLSTAAITRIDLFSANSANFVTGSIFSLYGMS